MQSFSVSFSAFCVPTAQVRRDRSDLSIGTKVTDGRISSDSVRVDDVDLVMVIMRFDAADVDRLMSVLSRYVVVARGHEGCRNIDLAVSATAPRQVVVIQKWTSAELQRAHFDSPDMVAMARACDGLLAGPPDIDLLTPISAHDLR